MARFRYTAKTIEGKKQKGITDAPGEVELYQKLRGEGLYLLKSSLINERQRVRRIKAKALSEFSRELGTLLGAGVSLVRALNIICQEETIEPWQRNIYQNLLGSIRQGISLSEAMEQQGGVFPELLIHMFRSAEMSGNMDQVSLRMASHYEKEHRLNSKVVSAMIYPMVILCVSLAAVIVLVSVVVPMFSSMFSSMEELPLPTRLIMGASDILTNHWLALLIGVAVLVIAIRSLLVIPPVKLAKDKAKIKMPVFGKLLSVIYTARFTRTLSSLYSSGIPIVSALQIGKRTIGNTYLESQFDEAVSQVRKGGNLSAALGGIDGFVKRLPSAIVVGEETGQLDAMLNSISDDLDYSADVSITRMVSMLEPMLLLLMAVLVGFILLSVILPVMGSYSAIENYGG